jgi:cell wall-associated NlpC family hydrolase
VRLWDRSWLGVAVVVVAAAASGPAGSALAAGAPPVRASAEAVTILVPGAQAQGTGVVMAFGPGSARGGYRYPKKHAAAVKVGWAKTTAAKQTGASPTAAADSLVRRIQLLGGVVRARMIVVSVAVSPQAATAAGKVQGLQVLGRHVHPAAGATLKLSDWGVLDVLDSAQSQAGGSAAASVTGLKLTLLRDHHGLPAGTVIELAAARATITAAAPPPPPPPGGTSTTPRVPQRTHGATLHPRPAQRTAPRRHRPAHRPAGRHVRRTRHPAAPAPPPRATRALIAAAAGDRARVISAALGQVGWPYIWGGDDRADGGFDCSGLVDYAYDHAGLTLPGRPTAAVLWGMSTPVARARLQPGDLAFLYSRHRAPYHVALYVGDGLVVVAPHTGADVTIEPLSAVAWDGYGRLLRGGRGDGLARSVADAERRFAHPGRGERSRLIAGLAADALAARRVLPPGLRLDGIADGPTQTATAAIVPAPHLIPLASVRAPRAEGAGRVLGFAFLLLLAAACLVWAPIRAIRSSGN